MTKSNSVENGICFIQSSPSPFGYSERFAKKVQVGKDQEKAQSEKRFPLQKPRWEKTKLTVRYSYHETYRKPNEQLFSQSVATQLP